MATETTTKGLKLVNRGTVENDLEADTVYDFAGYHNDNMKIVNEGLEELSSIQTEIEDIQDSGIANNILYGGTFASQVVSIEVTDGEAMEASTVNTATFLVKRVSSTTTLLDSPLTVDLEHVGTTFSYETNPAGAKVGNVGTVVIPSMQTSLIVTISVSNNTVKEGDKVAIIRVKPSERYVVGGPSIGRITIKDND